MYIMHLKILHKNVQIYLRMYSILQNFMQMFWHKIYSLFLVMCFQIHYASFADVTEEFNTCISFR